MMRILLKMISPDISRLGVFTIVIGFIFTQNALAYKIVPIGPEDSKLELLIFHEEDPESSDTIPPDGHKTARLNRYEIRSESMKQIIERMFIPKIDTLEISREKNMFLISKFYIGGDMAVIDISKYSIMDCTVLVMDDFGWFESDGYMFIIDSNALEYFSEIEDDKLSIDFNYRCPPADYDPPTWYFSILGNEVYMNEPRIIE